MYKRLNEPKVAPSFHSGAKNADSRNVVRGINIIRITNRRFTKNLPTLNLFFTGKYARPAIVNRLIRAI